MKEIQDENDLKRLVNGNDMVALLCYRGDWCPFCKRQLKQLSKMMPDLSSKNDHFFAITADSVEKNSTLIKELKLPFEIISDPRVQLHKTYNSPISTEHSKAKSYPSGAFLQPAFFLFKNGNLMYEWKQTSKITNLGGAIFRISTKEIVDKISEYAS